MEYEARQHRFNSFITLTYAPEHLPEDLSLDVKHWQNFAKRLRKTLQMRFYHCGEYGSSSLRPHYHAAIFGWDWHKDRKLWKQTDQGHSLYTSESLDKVWGLGHCVVADFTGATASYIAKYTQKYEPGKRREERIDPITGEVWEVAPEYATMSRRPGIGAKFLEDYGDEIYQHDNVVSNGREYPVPRYYDRKLSEENPVKFDQVKLDRHRNRLVRSIRQAEIQSPHHERNREMIINRGRKAAQRKETL